MIGEKSMADWAENFKKKLTEQEKSTREASKNFSIYKDAVEKLFDQIEKKVSSVDQISTVRVVVGHFAATAVLLKALTLKYQGKTIRFVPEGINQDDSRGRIRIEHRCKRISPFVYLNLVIDPESEATYPENLMWVINLEGLETPDFDTLPRFEESHLEYLLEVCFLS